MRTNKIVKRSERGQSTLEMIAIAPMLFGFIFMVFSYGVPIYMKLGLQNISYSYAMGFTRFPSSTYSSLNSAVAVNITDGIPGFTSSDRQVYTQSTYSDASFITDLTDINNARLGRLIDTRITFGSEDPYFANIYNPDRQEQWGAKLVGGAIAPSSPFISCETDFPFCKYDTNRSSEKWVWTSE